MRTGKLTPEDWESMARGLGRLNDAAPILVDPHPLATIDRIRARARRAKRKHGIGLIVIDYLQLIEGQGDNANARITAISRGVKLLAMELDVPVVLLSQLNRELAKRPNKRPLMSDLRDSGAVEQDADVIVFVYRDEYYNPDNDDAKGKAEIIVAKNREGEVGTVYANFDGRYNRFASTEWRPGVGVPTGPAYRGQDDGL
jgi:replicative DNA helicase